MEENLSISVRADRSATPDRLRELITMPAHTLCPGEKPQLEKSICILSIFTYPTAQIWTTKKQFYKSLVCAGRRFVRSWLRSTSTVNTLPNPDSKLTRQLHKPDSDIPVLMMGRLLPQPSTMIKKICPNMENKNPMCPIQLQCFISESCLSAVSSFLHHNVPGINPRTTIIT